MTSRRATIMKSLGLGCLMTLACFLTGGAAAEQPDAGKTVNPNRLPLESSPTALPDQYRFAKGLWDRGLYKMAAEEFGAFSDEHPRNAYADRARYYRVRCYAALEQYEQALKAIAEVRNSATGDYAYAARLTLLAGQIHLELENAATAADELETLVDHANPQVSEAAIYFLGNAYSRQGKRPHATALYTRLAARPFAPKHPYRVYAASALAEIYRAVGQLNKAAGQYQRIADNPDSPVELKIQALYEAGELAAEQEEYARAAGRYQQIIEKYPDSSYGRPAMLRHMRMLLRANNPGGVIETVNAWQQKYPGESEAQVAYLHGLALQGIGKHQEAVAAFKKITATAGGGAYDRPALYQSCYSLLQLDNFAAALPACETFITKYSEAPNIADIYYFAGTAARALQKLEKASEYLHKALQAGVSTDNWPYRQAAEALLADVLDKTGNTVDAARLHDKLAQQTAGDNRISHTLEAAELFARGDELQTAIERYRRVTDQLEPGPEIRRYAALQCARLYLQQEQYAQAEKFLSGILTVPTLRQDPRLLMLLGLTRYRTENYGQASKTFRKVLQAPDTPPELMPQVRYLLTASLLEQKQTDDALEIFAPIVLKDTENIQATFDGGVLMELARLYYERGRTKLTKTICRHLLEADDASLAYEATQQLARSYIAENQLAEAEKLLVDATRTFPERLGEEQPAPCSELFSLLGEVYLLGGEIDQAMLAFRRSLAQDALSGADLARTQWGMARILKSEKRYEEALRHAVNGFVMAADKRYTPRTMWIAVQSLIELNRKKEALTTWKELRERFPAFAAQHAESDFIKTHFDGQ